MVDWSGLRGREGVGSADKRRLMRSFGLVRRDQKDRAAMELFLGFWDHAKILVRMLV
jgi:hypothetical protein